jgi:hypothetical protein
LVPKVIPDSPESPVNYWINDLRLYFEDKQILQENEDLHDRHITATIAIIAAQFPDMPPVQSSLRTKKISLLQSAQDNSLFFHNYNHHWALTYYNDGVVHLYDSLQPSALHRDIHGQISALYEGISVVRLEHTQLQKGCKDCGCFVIAFCTSILFGEEPSRLLYKQQEMRNHIITCFDNHNLCPFPATQKRAKQSNHVLSFLFNMLLSFDY